MKQFTESKERRLEIFNAYVRLRGSASRSIQRTMCEYDRYHEAGELIKTLEPELNSHFCVVDYGCGVGDYGMAFGRMGCMVLFYDLDPEIDFVNFRLENESEPFGHMTMPKSSSPELTVPAGGCQLAIFGEVLEHVPDPAAVLKMFADAGTKYIFTSSYPYRRDAATDDYWQHPGHLESARVQQPACRELLETRYRKIANYGGQMNLWRLR
jgi:hypothetical protein